MSTSGPSATRLTLASAALAMGLRDQLMRYLPFSQMRAEHIEQFFAASQELYFAPEEVILQPQDGVVQHLYFLRQGSVTGLREQGSVYDANIEYATGDLFPVAALMGGRAVSLRIKANTDTFCLRVDQAAVRALSEVSAPFAEVLSRQMSKFIEASRRAMQLEQTSAALNTQALERHLGDLIRHEPLTCRPNDTIEQALTLMHHSRRDSVHILDGEKSPVGILTRYDVLGRITLPQLNLQLPVSQVMSSPVKTLSTDDSAHEAALLMSREGLRHVPITHQGRLVGVVTEQDLFALQQLSIKQLNTTIRTAHSRSELQAAAQAICDCAATLLAQGVQAQQLTELISHLNDLLTRRIVIVSAQAHGRDLAKACWLAFGSEGRSEQTVATDQDNGLIFLSENPAVDRPAWLAFASEVNETLAACGYPLCKGNVMARNPQCCLTPQEWQARFAHWMDHGSPEDLLAASIFFDLRPVAGALELAQPLALFIAQRAQANPRFCRQLAEEVLRSPGALGWLGQIEGETIEGVPMLDLKLKGTAIFVGVARLRALALGLTVVNTRQRLQAIGRARGVPDHHAQAWISGFEFLQMLRLRVQIGAAAAPDHRVPSAGPNHVRLDTLNDIDQRILKETLRMVRRLQQEIELDYHRS